MMAVLMSIAFALPVFYICDLHGSFFLVWLVWLVSLADGIGAHLVHHESACLCSFQMPARPFTRICSWFRQCFPAVLAASALRSMQGAARASQVNTCVHPAVVLRA